MKLKKILASLTAAAMAVSVMAITPVSAAVGTVPEGSQVVLDSMLTGDDAVISTTVLDKWGSLWMKNYNTDIADWVAEDNTYLKVTLSAVGQYTNDDGSLTNIEDMLWALDQSWFTFCNIAGNKYSPVSGVTASGGGTIYAPLSDFTLSDDGGLGFNLQAGHVGMTIDKAEIIQVSTITYIETALPAPANKEVKALDGVDFDASKLTADAKLRVEFTTGAGSETEWGNSVSNGWGIGKVGIDDGESGKCWTDGYISAINSKGASQTVVAEYKISELAALSGDPIKRIYAQVYEGTSTLDKVSILDTVSVAVSKKEVESITLDKDTLELTEGGEAATLTATVLPEDATDKTVTWTSSDETIVTVADGKVTPVAVGTATVTAKAGDKTAECAVTVKAKTIPAESIILSDTAAELTVGEITTLTATITPENTTDTAVWSSDNEAVATVKDGVVTAVKAGTAKITVAAGDVSAECTVTVKNPEVPTITKTLSVNVGAAGKIVLGVPDDYVFPEGSKFTSDDETIATVAEDGTVTGVKAGTVEVWYAKDTAYDLALCCVVTVSDIAVESIALDKTTAELEIGATTTLTASVKPDNATVDTTVIWSSDNEAAATVKNGVVTAVAAGTANITATAGDKSAVCVVTVKAAEVKPEEPKPEDPPKPEEPKPETPPVVEEVVSYIAPTLHVYPSNGSTTNENIWTGTDTYEASKAALAVNTVANDGTINIVMDEATAIPQRVSERLANKDNVTLNLMYTGYTVTINSDDIYADEVGKLNFANGSKFLSKSERDGFAGADEVRQLNFSKADMSGIAKATVTVEFRGGSKKLPVTFIDRNGKSDYSVVGNATVSSGRTASFEILNGGKYIAAVGSIEISDDVSAAQGVEAEASSAAPAALALAVVAAAAFVVLKKVRA